MKNVLFIYNHTVFKNSSTIMDHVSSIINNSNHVITSINTELGFPKGIYKNNYDALILHYSLFGTATYCLTREHYEYIRNFSGLKIAMFQDEYQHCRQRFRFIDEYGIRHVFSIFEEDEYSNTYNKYCKDVQVHTTFTGFVSDKLMELGKAKTISVDQRRIDIGYRARRLPYYMGKGAQEKHLIAEKFREIAQEQGYKVDIETEEHKRIYGDAWFNYLADCKFVLGVESGVSVVDIDDVVYPEYLRMMREKPETTFDEFYESVLMPWEDNIRYRAISPRLFEAAAFRVTQILFEGHYNGIVKPYVHYIPLKKDFSNIQEVLSYMKDDAFCSALADQAYNDLIQSGNYHYRVLANQIDTLIGESSDTEALFNDSDLQRIRYPLRSIVWAYAKWPLYHNFPGRVWVIALWKALKNLKSTH